MSWKRTGVWRVRKDVLNMPERTDVNNGRIVDARHTITRYVSRRPESVCKWQNEERGKGEEEEETHKGQRVCPQSVPGGVG